MKWTDLSKNATLHCEFSMRNGVRDDTLEKVNLIPFSKYKEGLCVMPNTPEAAKIQARANIINKRIVKNTLDITSINSRVNKMLLDYSNFKFSISSVDVDSTARNNLAIVDKTSTVSTPTFAFTLATSPIGNTGDQGNQGLPGNRGDPGSSGTRGFPGYWGQRGGCST